LYHLFSPFNKVPVEQGPSLFQTDVTKHEQELEKQITTLEQLLGKKELEIQLLKKYLDFYAPRVGNLLSTRERW
jgi:hypothetical protein